MGNFIKSLYNHLYMLDMETMPEDLTQKELVFIARVAKHGLIKEFGRTSLMARDFLKWTEETVKKEKSD